MGGGRDKGERLEINDLTSHDITQFHVAKRKNRELYRPTSG